MKRAVYGAIAARKRKTLAQHISSIIQKKISAIEVEGVIVLLFASKQISEENDAITYSFQPKNKALQSSCGAPRCGVLRLTPAPLAAERQNRSARTACG